MPRLVVPADGADSRASKQSDTQSTAFVRLHSRAKIDKDAVELIRRLALFKKAYVAHEEDQDDVRRIQRNVEEHFGCSTDPAVLQTKQWYRKTLQTKEGCFEALCQGWSDLNDRVEGKQGEEFIFACLSLGGDMPRQFLDALAIRIKNRKWLHKRRWQWKSWKRIKVKQGPWLDDVAVSPPIELAGETFGDAPAAAGGAPPQIASLLPLVSEQTRADVGLVSFANLFRPFMDTSKRVEWEIYWTGVNGLFCRHPGAEEQRRDHLYLILIHLLNDQAPEVYSLPIVQALARYHWNIIFTHGYLWDRCFDAATLLALGNVAHQVHFGNQPLIWVLAFLQATSLLSLVRTGSAMYAFRRQFRTILPMARPFLLISVALEIAGFVIISLAVGNDYGDIQEYVGQDYSDYLNMTLWKRAGANGTNFLTENPGWLALVIGLKWAYFLLALVNLEFVGRSVLAAFEAAKSQASLIFLVYLLMGAIGASHAYYAFPVDEVHSFWMAFIRMMRLFWLGDFDMYELEGVDDQLDITNASALLRPANGSTLGVVDEIDAGHSWRFSVRVYALLIAYMGPVLLMSLYIGLLSNAYSEALSRIISLFTKFRISNTMVHVLRRRVLRPFLPCLYPVPEKSDGNGFWFAVQKSLTAETKTQSQLNGEDLQDLKDKLDELLRRTAVTQRE